MEIEIGIMHHDKHHSDKHHPDKHHTLKGATINASPVNSSHPVGRHRSRSFTRKDTSHSVGSVKGHSHKDHDRGSASSTGDLHPEVYSFGINGKNHSYDVIISTLNIHS
jgi:hypothetical protein